MPIVYSILLIILITAESICAQFPTIQWQRSLGGTDIDIANSIQQTTDGGYIMAGKSFSDDGDITQAHTGFFSTDYWVVKLTAEGNVDWQKSLGGTGQDVATSVQQTIDGGYIIAGYSNSEDGDVIENNGSFDYWIVKLSSDGNIVWQKSLGGSSSDIANSIEQTDDGGYIIAGESRSVDGDIIGHHGTNSYTDYWIIKLDGLGNLVWQKSLGGTDDESAVSIKQLNGVGYVVAGMSFSNNGDLVTNYGNEDYWIVQLDTLGNIVWQKSLGGTNTDIPKSIKQTSDRGYIVTGYSYSNDIDVVDNHGASDYWIVKLDASGNLVWQKSLGGTNDDMAFDILENADNTYTITGRTASNDINVKYNHGGNTGSYDNWLVTINEAGTIIWQKSLGGTNGDHGYAIQPTTDGGYIIAGESESNDGDVTGHHGNYYHADYWIVKLGSIPTTLTKKLNTNVTIHPNPFTDELYIKNASGLIGIYNNLGQLVFTQNITSATQKIDVSSLAKGMYVIKTNNTNFKVIKS